MNYYVLMGILCFVGSIAFAFAGVLGVRKFIHGHVAEGHNDVLVPMFLTAGVIYAVLLAFIVIAMWESYDNAKANTAQEASLLVPLYRDSLNMAPEKGVVMRSLLREYAEGVIAGWGHFRVTAQGAPAARLTVDKIILFYGNLTPATRVREFIAQQYLETLNQLLLARNTRLLQAAETLSWVMWVASVGGGIVTVGMSFFLYMDRPKFQVGITSVLSLLIGMLLFIMVILERPFLGPLGIEPEPFEASLKLFNAIDADVKQIGDPKLLGSEPSRPNPAADHK
ncbi:MAG TPA: hypothetical protein VNU97_19185 [Rhizomicrobium sp.]|jgi:hypothetical protein|nr:hypothetical protein [Rhizomicrobium sp.]